MLISSAALGRKVPDLPPGPDGIAARLLAAGVEVEEITPLSDLLRPVVVGRVDSVEPHPDADRLRICRVHAGGDETLQIVTGAPNVRAGAFYPLIRAGTRLPDGTRIRKGKLRGQLSEGMLGSADELGLGLDGEGLLEIPAAEPGTPLPDAMPVDGYMVRIAGIEQESGLDAALEGKGATELQIDVFADIACPWCYIGERRLEQALRERGHLQVVWRWRPYQLQPAIPADGLPWAEFVAGKFGAGAAAAFAHVTSVGAEDGVEFRFDRIARAPNTADAHRLILLAARSGRSREAASALFDEHFTRGGNLSDREVLIAVGARMGLDEGEVRAWLAGEQGASEVRESQDTAARLGISGVPFYIFNGRVAVSGAQDAATFARAIEMSLREDDEPG